METFTLDKSKCRSFGSNEWWNSLVDMAETIKARIGLMRNADGSLLDLEELWQEYRDIIGTMERMNPEYIGWFRRQAQGLALEAETRFRIIDEASPEADEDWQEALEVLCRRTDHAHYLGRRL